MLVKQGVLLKQRLHVDLKLKANQKTYILSKHELSEICKQKM